MKDQEEIRDLFEDKYEAKLGIDYGSWLDIAPETEVEAYARLQQIDDELKASYEEWFEAVGEAKDELEEAREKLKAEYEFIEEIFGLELKD